MLENGHIYNIFRNIWSGIHFIHYKIANAKNCDSYFIQCYLSFQVQLGALLYVEDIKLNKNPKQPLLAFISLLCLFFLLTKMHYVHALKHLLTQGRLWSSG